MMNQRIHLAIIVGGLIWGGQSPSGAMQDLRLRYSVGSYSGDPDQGGGGYGLQSVVVHTPDGASHTIRLPFAISRFRHSSDGRALYASAMYTESAARMGFPGAPDRPGLYRFDLPSMRMTEVPVSPSLELFDLAVAERQDRLVVSAQIRSGGRIECGLYEVLLPGGQMKVLMQRSDCEARLAWRQLSLSPDGEKLFATRRQDVELINLSDRSIRRFGKGNAAIWSPDGAWVALVDDDGVDLLEAPTLKKRRRISVPIAGRWSPDSRYLIGEEHAGCGAYRSTLSAIDVVTGKKTIFESSRCTVNGGLAAWFGTGLPDR